MQKRKSFTRGGKPSLASLEETISDTYVERLGAVTGGIGSRESGRHGFGFHFLK